MWIERAQRRECWAEEGTARAVRRDTRGGEDEDVEMVGQGRGRGGGEDGGDGDREGGDGYGRDRDGRCETEVCGGMVVVASFHPAARRLEMRK